MNAITTPFTNCLTNVPTKTTSFLPTAAMAVVLANLSTDDLAGVLAPSAITQAVAAAFSISEGTEDTMALVKLISVSTVAPVLSITAVLISVARAEVMSQSSRWLLRLGVFAVGIAHDLKRVLAVEKPANALLITETIFIAGLILLGINYLS